MGLMSEYGVVYITASSQEEAEKIAAHLVATRLVACVNIFPGIQSLFWWEGKLCREQEVFMMAKTRASLFGHVCDEVKKLHSYKVPEIILLPIEEGSADYLQWIKYETK
jgi:periplasmic divalent cation tolerance protein